jgi:hypothetical protein
LKNTSVKARGAGMSGLSTVGDAIREKEAGIFM